MLTFGDWLAATIKDRGWNQSELARRASISQATLSRLINETRQPGPDVCLSLSRALHVPPETVFKHAGLLPPDPAPVSQEKEALSLFRRLPETARDLILTQLRALAAAQTRPAPATTESRIPYHAAPDALAPLQPETTDLERELLDEFRQLPDQWQREALDEIEKLQRYANQVRIIGDEREQTP